MKRFISMLLCFVMVAAVFAFAGCKSEEKKDGAAEVIEKYMTAQSEKDSDTIVDLMPPYLYNYNFNRLLEKKSEEQAEEIIKRNHSPIIKNINHLMRLVPTDYMVNEGIWYDYFHIEYEIMESYAASNDEVSEFNKYNSNKFSSDVKAENISIAVAKFKIIGQNGEDVTENLWNYLFFICLEIDGKWYITEANHTYDDDIWRTREYFEEKDRIEWIHEKVYSYMGTYNFKNEE